MNTTQKYLGLTLGLLLGSFFIYKGLDKHWLSPCKVYGPDSTLPIYYQQVITALCASGFLKIIGTLEIVSGLLLLLPRTRMVGAFMLLPVIVTIFLLHLFLDNRPHELVETGIPLALTLIIIGLHHHQWRKALRND